MSEVDDARTAAAGGGIEVELELQIEGWVTVKLPIARARKILEALDKGETLQLGIDDYGIDWVKAIDELNGVITDVEFVDPDDDEEVDAPAKDGDDD
jgi:hypothetical protein